MEDNYLLKVENVTYDTGKSDLLTNISFALKKGENIVLFGPEDSGVEIICPLLAGMINEYQGEIFFKGRSIRLFDYLENHTYRKELGYLQRDYGLISNMSVTENISLPLKYHSKLSTQEIDEFVNDRISALNLVHCRDNRPVNLSRSEKLRTAYLRAVILNPELTLLEHAFEGQCLFNIRAFLKNLEADYNSKSKSYIFVTYNPRLYVGLSERFIMLYKGNIVFEGSQEDISSTDNPYVRQYFSLSVVGPMKIM